jgi:hypothetical protein
MIEMNTFNKNKISLNQIKNIGSINMNIKKVLLV